MFNAIFYSFSKRTNSTKQPNTQGTTIPIVLLDSTDIINPRIRLNIQNPISYNYCEIPTFNRKYFIQNWESDHGQWIASLKIDVLGSYKTEILSFEEYILRSASEFDGYIVDSLYPVEKGVQTSKFLPRMYLSDPYDPSDVNYYYPLKADESFIVGIYGQLSESDFSSALEYNKYLSQATRGSVSYYWLSLRQLSMLISYLNSDNSLQMMGITDIGDGMQKALINPLQYIASIKAVPLTAPMPGFTPDVQTTTKVAYGWYKIPIADIYGGSFQGVWNLFNVNEIYESGTNIYNPLSCYIDLRSQTNIFNGLHPQSETRGRYLESYPFTKLRLIFDPFGEINIDTNLIANQFIKALYCEISIEGIEGLAILNVYPVTDGFPSGFSIDRSKLLARVESQVGIDISVNQLAVNNLQTMGGIIGTVGSTVGNILTGNVVGAISSVSSVFVIE